jgi:hypothetical protein
LFGVKYASSSVRTSEIRNIFAPYPTQELPITGKRSQPFFESSEQYITFKG